MVETRFDRGVYEDDGGDSDSSGGTDEDSGGGDSGGSDSGGGDDPVTHADLLPGVSEDALGANEPAPIPSNDGETEGHPGAEAAEEAESSGGGGDTVDVNPIKIPDRSYLATDSNQGPEKVAVQKGITVQDQRTNIGTTPSGGTITRADAILKEADAEEKRINLQNQKEFIKEAEAQRFKLGDKTLTRQKALQNIEQQLGKTKKQEQQLEALSREQKKENQNRQRQNYFQGLQTSSFSGSRTITDRERANNERGQLTSFGTAASNVNQGLTNLGQSLGFGRENTQIQGFNPAEFTRVETKTPDSITLEGEFETAETIKSNFELIGGTDIPGTSVQQQLIGQAERNAEAGLIPDPGRTGLKVEEGLEEEGFDDTGRAAGILTAFGLQTAKSVPETAEFASGLISNPEKTLSQAEKGFATTVKEGGGNVEGFRTGESLEQQVAVASIIGGAASAGLSTAPSGVLRTTRADVDLPEGKRTISIGKNRKSKNTRIDEVSEQQFPSEEKLPFNTRKPVEADNVENIEPRIEFLPRERVEYVPQEALKEVEELTDVKPEGSKPSKTQETERLIDFAEDGAETSDNDLMNLNQEARQKTNLQTARKNTKPPETEEQNPASITRIKPEQGFRPEEFQLLQERRPSRSPSIQEFTETGGLEISVIDESDVTAPSVSLSEAQDAFFESDIGLGFGGAGSRIARKQSRKTREFQETITGRQGLTSKDPLEVEADDLTTDVKVRPDRTDDVIDFTEPRKTSDIDGVKSRESPDQDISPFQPSSFALGTSQFLGQDQGQQPFVGQTQEEAQKTPQRQEQELVPEQIIGSSEGFRRTPEDRKKVFPDTPRLRRPKKGSSRSGRRPPGGDIPDFEFGSAEEEPTVLFEDPGAEQQPEALPSVDALITGETTENLEDETVFTGFETRPVETEESNEFSGLF